MKHFQNAGKRLSLRLIIWHFGTAKNYNSNPMAEVPMVDDERMLREGLEMALHGEGFEVRTDRDGDEALKKIRYAASGLARMTTFPRTASTW